MGETPTANEKPPGEGVEQPPRHCFTLTDLLTFVTSVPVCIGVIAAVEFTATNQSYEWFGIAWHSDLRYFLVENVGVPSNFVTEYVTFALSDFPAWVCYGVIGLIFGLIRAKWALTVGLVFVMSIFVWDLLSDYFSGLHTLTNLRLVSLFGALIAALCFAVTRKIRGRWNVPKRRAGRVVIGFICLAITSCLAVSIYGWWLVGVNREAGLEVQEMFRNAMPE